MENRDEIRKNWIIDLIKDSGYGCLATIENNQPKVRPMMPHLTDDGVLLIAMLSHSRSISQIKVNPHVEMCFIDRKMCFCRISGNGKISNDINNKELVWNSIPMLRNYFSGPVDPNYVLLEIDTATIETMTPAQKSPDSVSYKLKYD